MVRKRYGLRRRGQSFDIETINPLIRRHRRHQGLEIHLPESLLHRQAEGFLVGFRNLLQSEIESGNFFTTLNISAQRLRNQALNQVCRGGL